MNLLVVDDQKSSHKVLNDILSRENYKCTFAKSIAECKNIISNNDFRIALLDLMLPDGYGTDLIVPMKDKFGNIPIIMISGHGTIELAVEAIKLGAYDFLEKPLDKNRLLITVDNAAKISSLKEQYENLQKSIFGEFIGESECVKQLFEKIKKIAPLDCEVLITGESGTGKDIIARIIHKLSPRSDKKFLKVNCAALPEGVIESELFGHRKGKFTGAYSDYTGIFEACSGGTVFLDEIGELPHSLQAKLLEVIEYKTFRRLGDSFETKVDTRIITATNRNLEEEIKNSNFREDLYYRISNPSVNIPPLENRSDDIPTLANHFVNRYCEKYEFENKRISLSAMEILVTTKWKGNVRELKNTIHNIVILSNENLITEYDVNNELSEIDKNLPKSIEERKSLKQQLCEKEAEIIKNALILFKRDVDSCANHLGMDKSNIYRKMKQYNL